MASEASGAPASDCAPASSDIPSQDGGPPNGSGHGHDVKGHGFMALALGSIGVVFGDIGTSPLYALREALAHSRSTTATEHAVLGVVSLVLWTMTLFVTIKYVIFFMRADNKGAGGGALLMRRSKRPLGAEGGKRSVAVFFLGVIGAALFYGAGIITPAISVLSAVEGLKDAPHVGKALSPYILPISAGILIALF